MSNRTPRAMLNQLSTRIGSRQMITNRGRFIPPKRVEEEAAEPCLPLQITFDRPAYVPAPTNPTGLEFYVKFGTVNGIPPSNFREAHQYFLVGQTYIYADVTLGQQENLTVTAVDLIVSNAPLAENSTWNVSQTRPASVNVNLGYIASPLDATTPSGEIIADTGDIRVKEYLVSYNANSGDYVRNLDWERV